MADRPALDMQAMEAALIASVDRTNAGDAAGTRLLIRSLDVRTFDAAALITSLRGFWGPDDVSEDPAADE